VERCLECNGLLTRKEKACPMCGRNIGHGKRSVGEFQLSAGRLVFYVSISVLIVSRFTPGGFGFVLSLCACACGLLFLTRTKKR
jgi:hypothetical protein